MIRPGRPRKGEETIRRDQLLDHGLRLFVEHGYANVSLETIAREARVSLRTIYRHFGGKEELFGAAIRRLSDHFVAVLAFDPAEPKPFEEVLYEFAKEFLFRLTRPEALRLRAQLLAESRRLPGLAAEFYTQGPERTLHRLAQVMALQQRAGVLMEEEAAEFLAGQFIGALRGERFQRLQLGLEAAPEEAEIEPWARRVVGLFLRGAERAGPNSESPMAGRAMARPSPNP